MEFSRWGRKSRREEPERRLMLTFSHEKLDVYVVAREALVAGDAIVRTLPRGYGAHADQLRRSLLSTFLGVAEGVNRTGADRSMRCRIARAEAAESAALLDGL